MRFVMSCVGLCLVLAASPLFCFLQTGEWQCALQEIATKAGKSLVVQEVGEPSQVIAPQVLPDGGADASLPSFSSIAGEDFAEPTFLETLRQRFGEVAWGDHGKTAALKTGKFLGHSAAIVGASAFNLVWRTLCVGGRFAKDSFDLFAKGKINPPQFLDGRWKLFGKYEPLSWSPQTMPDDVAFRDEAVNAMKIGVVSLTPLANLVLNTLGAAGETAWSLGGDVYRAVRHGEVAKPNLVKKLLSAD